VAVVVMRVLGPAFIERAQVRTMERLAVGAAVTAGMLSPRVGELLDQDAAPLDGSAGASPGSS
jgi:hypothetical protein